MGQAPKWAKKILEKVVQENFCSGDRAPELNWVITPRVNDFAGEYDNISCKITCKFNKDTEKYTKKAVLLHELAHWISRHESSRIKKSLVEEEEHHIRHGFFDEYARKYNVCVHTWSFYEICFRLFFEYGLDLKQELRREFLYMGHSAYIGYLHFIAYQKRLPIYEYK